MDRVCVLVNLVWLFLRGLGGVSVEVQGFEI